MFSLFFQKCCIGLTDMVILPSIIFFVITIYSLRIGMHVVSDSFEKIKETVQLLFYPSFCLSWLRRHGHKLMITR
jgi:hypothetical protein